MFLNNSQRTDNIPPQNQEANKLRYLNSNIPDKNDDDDIDLSELIRLFRRRGLIIIGTTITLAAALSTWILIKPPVYEGKFQLLVEPLTSDRSNIDFLNSVAGQQIKPVGLDYESQIDVLKSPLVMSTIIPEIQSLYPELKAKKLMGKLNLQQSGKTKILEVSYKDESKEEIIFVLNKIMKGYLEYQTKEYISNLTKAQKFTANQINRVLQDVATFESKLERFQKANNLISPDTQNDVLSSQAGFLSQQIENVKIDLSGMEKLSNELADKLNLTPEQGVIVSRLNQETNYLKLISQIKEIDTQIALESVRLGSQHPIIKTLTSKKAELVSLLNQETYQILGSKSSNLSLDFLTSITNNVDVIQQFFDTNNQIEVLRSKEKQLNMAWENLNKQVKTLSTINKEYFQIQRDLKTANESLNRLLAINESLQIEVAKQASPWKLLTPIDQDSIKNISGTNQKIALISIASLFVGSLLGFLADKLDSAFHTIDDVKNSIDLPALAIIPYNKSLEIFKSKKNKSIPRSFNQGKGLFAEKESLANLDAYFSLYTNINLLSSDSSIRSIVIGAAEAGEGKSTTSAFLAKAAAMLGKRVLIVDVDMRKPKIHKYLGVKNNNGLSNLITDDLPLEAVIQEVSEQENLFVITAGSKPPNPTRIISSQKMRTFMEKFKEDFDLVIYDTPPLIGFSDCKIILPFSDGLVLIVRLGKTHRPNVQQALNDLRIAKMSVLGMVLNGVKKSMVGYGYDYGYYDYKNYYQDDED
ncbi:polysaccharide biosynthesis tyrosine autokinase [Geminocystis sp. GBBB08]|uniref:GumC family protein n=1 Tax=Geminocystis sp. GBBB08 TaxID=2604140 RepID=UPI0027E2C06C|nr:polysaccharide biosynthesis tyrosine autokinase [Geminocystis sp. GBBB08]MBL1208868.1 polysaccharide biosynthesis tyrosine autokinase [Geminocystis sp. GBBB08]